MQRNVTCLSGQHWECHVLLYEDGTSLTMLDRMPFIVSLYLTIWNHDDEVHILLNSIVLVTE